MSERCFYGNDDFCKIKEKMMILQKENEILRKSLEFLQLEKSPVKFEDGYIFYYFCPICRAKMNYRQEG